MILSCPQCNARFLVPDAAIGSTGRTVRCGKCAHQWFCDPLPNISAPPPAAAVAEEKPAAAAPAPDIDRLMQDEKPSGEAPPPKPIPSGSNLPVAPKRLPLRLKLAWLVLMGAAAYACILAFLPALVGLPDSRELVFTDVRLKQMPPLEAGQRFSKLSDVYYVEGFIVNNGAKPLPPPGVRIVLVDRNGVQVREWQVQHTQASIAPGESMPFVAPELETPRAEGMKFRLDLGNKLELALRPTATQ
jgi:predicted Zn finger-like uncharacterized protein